MGLFLFTSISNNGICGLAGILALMIPAHVSVWSPLYTEERMSSTAVIAFFFIPFYCIVTMGIGVSIAFFGDYLIEKMRGSWK